MIIMSIRESQNMRHLARHIPMCRPTLDIISENKGMSIFILQDCFKNQLVGTTDLD